MPEELKPCLECKQVPNVYTLFQNVWWYAECDCKQDLIGYPTEQEAIEAWMEEQCQKK